MTKNEILKKAVISKLICEGVSADNYNYNYAVLILSDCVRAGLLTDYLRNNQDIIINGLSQIKQQFATDEQLNLFQDNK